MITVIEITSEGNTPSEPKEVASLPEHSLRNVFDGSVYHCYLPGSIPPILPIEE